MSTKRPPPGSGPNPGARPIQTRDGHGTERGSDRSPGSRLVATGAAGPDGDGDSALGQALRHGAKAALARWVLQQRGRTLRGGESDEAWPTPRDEGTHPPGRQRHYLEAYSFAAVQRGMGVLVRLAWLPGRDAQRVWVVFFDESGAYAIPEMIRGGQAGLWRSPSTGRVDDRWRAGGLALDCTGPLRTWTLRYKGPLAKVTPDDGHRGSRMASMQTLRASLDLTFEADADPFVPGRDDDPELVARNLGAAHWDRKLLRAIRKGRSRGYVQTGRATGTLALGDRVLAIGASVLREHTWGVEDFGASDTALRAYVDLPSGARTWIHRAQFPWLTLEGGFLSQAEHVRPVRALGVTIERRPGASPLRMGLNIDHGLANLEVEARVVSDLGLDVDGRGHVRLALVRTGKGDDEGWGLWVAQHRKLPRRAPVR